MFRILEHARYRWIGLMYFVTMIAWGTSLIFIQPQIYKAVFCGSFCALVLIVDRLIEYGLRRMYRRVYSGSPKRTNQAEVNVVLRDLAVAWQRDNNEQAMVLAIGYDSESLVAQAVKQRISFAKRTFWRAHWLARLFGFEVKKSWKDYLPPAQPA